ncbi:probable receptor-like protein kinase At5g59700 [Phoenix dactylifera]|uniref:Probable receptor-like protein kinase At5g59700 n=1 Tax=Phoenix dactylifera TaxID=42345 RepID=A0A8B7CQ54_PHODC|nr:probable receptor-like protein kinase At5g59700 [Phoenix dactylifera]
MELLLGITILSLFFHLSSSAFTPNNSYFLACGSTSTISLTSDSPPRSFVPDSNFLRTSNSLTLSNPNASPNSPTLYATARAFTEPSSYQFTLDIEGTHVLRLHFFPFSAQNHDLSAARFNVSALDRFLLLADFAVPNTSTPIIKEYLLWVDTGELTITFTPNSNSGTSSLAFVNAIEVFTAPTSLLGNSDPLSIAPSGNINQLQRQALETVYRINVGGPKVTPANDTLWRTWVPDDDYLLSKALSQVNSTTRISYSDLDSAEVAPQLIYLTARSMNPGSMVETNPNFNFNITWRFPVTPGYSYFIRMHFCDIVSKTFTALYFDVYIGDQFAQENLHPADYTDNLAEAFFRDFALDVPTSQQVLHVSIGRSLSKTTPQTANAILNGLEIMKVNNSVGSLNGTFNPGSVPSQDNKKNLVSPAVLIPSIVGGVLLIILAITALVFCRRRRAKPVPKPKESPVSWSPYRAAVANFIGVSSKSTDGTAPNASPNFNLGLHIPFAEIKSATNDFDEKLVIGTGGFGKVYGGTLRDGTRVAVKRGMRGSRQGYPEFQTEIIVLSQIRHRHLVSLIGYCDDWSEMILVYEYMEKGPLRKHLYGSDFPCLSWKQRLDVCIGAARGLHYLHTGYSHNIIHRDVKSTNILLGENFLAKVADFGLSRSGPSYGETHVSTGVKGTFGYLDPEYFKVQKLTDKSDVYSFGVLLFEVLCARPVIDQRLTREQVNLAEWALEWQRRGQLEKIIDPRLEGKINVNSLRKFGEIAEKCLAEYGVNRPTMGDVLWNLEYALQLQETELKREPFEDSVNMHSQISVAAVGPSPSTTISIDDEEGDGMTRMSEDAPDITTTINVFSQLVTGEGR